MAHQAEDTSHGFNFVYVYVPPGASIIGSSQAVALPWITPSWNNLDYKSPVTSAGAMHVDSDASIIISDQLANGDVLSSTTAYERERQQQVQDIFAVDVYSHWSPHPVGPPFGGDFYHTESDGDGHAGERRGAQARLARGPDVELPGGSVLLQHQGGRVLRPWISTAAAEYIVRPIPSPR